MPLNWYNIDIERTSLFMCHTNGSGLVSHNCSRVSLARHVQSTKQTHTKKLSFLQIQIIISIQISFQFIYVFLFIHLSCVCVCVCATRMALKWQPTWYTISIRIPHKYIVNTPIQHTRAIIYQIIDAHEFRFDWRWCWNRLLRLTCSSHDASTYMQNVPSKALWPI